MILQKFTSAQKYGVNNILRNEYFFFSKDSKELIKCDSNHVIKDLYLK